MCDFYLRLGMEENTPKVHVALYVRTTYCAKEIFDTVANNYQIIVEDLKMSVKNDEHILDLNVQPQVYVYSDDNVRPLFIAAGKVRNGISFWVDRDYGPP